MNRNRQLILAALLALLLAVAAVVLGAVLGTVVFAITVAYVLYPIKRWLRRRGFSDRLASGAATATAFIGVALIFAPLAGILYRRREQFIELLRGLPDAVTVGAVGTELTIELQPVIESTISILQSVAVGVAVSAPGLALRLALFTLLLYGLLYRPQAIRQAAFAVVPSPYHDIVSRLNRRTKTTLYSLYVLQAATAAATFLIALVLFALLGYSAPFTLAAVAGILQFVPILGPSMLVLALAANDVLLGAQLRAGLVLVTGLLLISLLPDALIRTKLAEKTGKIQPSLYFVGFVGGILTIGALGIIIGPLVVALLVEVVSLLAERGQSATSEEPTDPAVE